MVYVIGKGKGQREGVITSIPFGNGKTRQGSTYVSRALMGVDDSGHWVVQQWKNG